jgi:hypothetical protein
MDVEQLLAEVAHLDENALEQLKQEIARRESELRAQQRPHTAEEWGIVVNQFLDDFWADTPAEEQNNIIEAIRIKNIPLDRDV